MRHPDDEMFDDLHQGVFELREVIESDELPLNQKVSETLNRLELSMPKARSQWADLKESLKIRAVEAAKATNDAAKQNPWAFTVGALGIGLLAGILLGGSGSDEESQ